MTVSTDAVIIFLDDAIALGTQFDSVLIGDARRNEAFIEAPKVTATKGA